MKPMLSIVVVSNNQEKLNDLLLDSLKKQVNVEYELIIVNGDDYSSASSALNVGADKTTAEYILFVHHDIVFNSYNSLANMLNYLDLLDKEYALLGVAGVYADEAGSRQLLMGIENGPSKSTWTHHELLSAEEVFSVDECAFMISRTTFMKYKFADLGKTWHFYASELCLRVKSDGLKVGVIPADLWHCSLGSLSLDFFRVAKDIGIKYKDKFPTIMTTCIVLRTDDKLWRLKLLKKKIKYFKETYLNV